MPSRKPALDAETLAFQAQLLTSVKQMAARKAAARKRVKVPAVVRARLASGLSQAQFAQLLGISVRTLQKWEQGEREPSGAAQSLIKIAHKHPQLLLEALR
ncbi:MAG: helix-turn-helix domain-containing protein [Betaproteobacteria bacterium]|nr:helix-turn-helix domain-containing protein [Betaproteobacteria bacterium]MDE2047255.1 helix-turn-helix domain-containing protein [Betaproteobacteria bacterium]